MFCARLGGDEFVLLTKNHRQDDMSQLATSVLSCFQAPFMLEGHEVYISASLGLCSYPQDGQDVETLLKKL